MTKEQIINAYCKIRTIDQTIPDDVLDFMKDSAIEKLESQWISVKDRLPMVHHSLLMYKRDYQYPHTNGYCIGEFDGENWLYMSEPIIEPTHWMTLPEQPKV